MKGIKNILFFVAFLVAIYTIAYKNATKVGITDSQMYEFFKLQAMSAAIVVGSIMACGVVYGLIKEKLK